MTTAHLAGPWGMAAYVDDLFVFTPAREEEVNECLIEMFRSLTHLDQGAFRMLLEAHVGGDPALRETIVKLEDERIERQVVDLAVRAGLVR